MHTVDIRENNQLSCQDVLQFQNQLPTLLITTDCDDTQLLTTSNYPNQNIFDPWTMIGEFLLLPPLLIILFVLIKLKQGYTISANKCQEGQLSDIQTII